MTAAALYETDSDFRALIQCWIDNRRCPLPMADYLRERGLEGQAEAAEWAFWDSKTADDKGFAFPRTGMRNVWWCYTQTYMGKYYNPDNGIPEELQNEEEKRANDCLRYFPTLTQALLWLLDRWAEVKAAGVELPKVEAGVVTN